MTDYKNISNIRLEKIGKNMPEFGQIKRLYLAAFPDDERAPFPLLAGKARRSNVEWLAIFADKTFVGFFYNVLYGENLVYIFYFAIEENLRGRGYGSAAMSALKRKYAGKRLFLAMEEMDEAAENFAQRQRRCEFYEFNGFENTHTKLLEGRVIYDVMAIGGTVSKEEYHNLMMGWLGWWRLFVHTEILG